MRSRPYSAPMTAACEELKVRTVHQGLDYIEFHWICVFHSSKSLYQDLKRKKRLGIFSPYCNIFGMLNNDS
jgi:hypothetical protein